MKSRATKAAMRREDFESELLAHLMMRSPITQKSLSSRFDPYITGKLHPVLRDLEKRGLIACHADDPYEVVTITALGQAQIGQRRSQ